MPAILILPILAILLNAANAAADPADAREAKQKLAGKRPAVRNATACLLDAIDEAAEKHGGQATEKK